MQFKLKSPMIINLRSIFLRDSFPRVFKISEQFVIPSVPAREHVVKIILVLLESVNSIAKSLAEHFVGIIFDSIERETLTAIKTPPPLRPYFWCLKGQWGVFSLIYLV